MQGSSGENFLGGADGRGGSGEKAHCQCPSTTLLCKVTTGRTFGAHVRGCPRPHKKKKLLKMWIAQGQDIAARHH